MIGWKETASRCRTLIGELTGTPLFPLLFIQKYAETGAKTGDWLNVFLPWSIAATVLWVGVFYLKNPEVFVEEVAETAEEITDEK